MFQLMAFTPESTMTAWERLMTLLGLANVAEGQRVESLAGGPRLAGIVERVGPAEHPELLLRLTEPAPGLAHFFAMPMGGNVCLPVRVFHYGAEASATVAREEPRWQGWLNERFPAMNGVTGAV